MGFFSLYIISFCSSVLVLMSMFSSLERSAEKGFRPLSNYSDFAVNVLQQKNISRQLCLKLGFAGCTFKFFSFQSPFTQFSEFLGGLLNLSHLRSVMKMENVSRREGVYAGRRNNSLNFGKTSEIKEERVDQFQFLCSEVEPSN